jgi:hypothetical protein
MFTIKHIRPTNTISDIKHFFNIKFQKKGIKSKITAISKKNAKRLVNKINVIQLN